MYLCIYLFIENEKVQQGYSIVLATIKLCFFNLLYKDLESRNNEAYEEVLHVIVLITFEADN